jgi:AraC family transcriptional regulator, transcriptional activator of pobA
MARRSVRTMPLGEYSGTTIQRLRIQNLLLTENKFPSNLSIEDHSHAYPHFTIMLDGGFTETYEGQQFVCERGDVLIVPEGQPHTDVIDPKGAHSLSIEISRSLVKFLTAESDLLARPYIIRSTNLKSPILNLKKLFLKTENPSPFELHSAAMHVILGVSRAIRKDRHQATAKPPWLAEVMQILKADLTRTPSLAELAKAVHVSPSHLSRTFRQCTDLTVREYKRSVRLVQAAKALETSTDSIAIIAAETGFYDQAHLCRDFKRAYGVTPSTYRANIT